MRQQTRIGTTELMVTPIGLGTNKVGGHNLFSNLKDEDGKNIVRRALELGIDFLDTAYIYGPARSEELIGEVLKENGQRENVVIATKGAHKIEGNDTLIDNSPAFLRQSVEDSLKRLQTDYIDLYYIHFPDKDTPKDEAVGELKKLKEEGKIRAIGVSNFSIEQLKQANRHGDVDVLQSNYNLLEREVEQEFFPYLVENKISFVPYFPLASGLLGGKYTKDTPLTDSQKKKPLFQEGNYEKNLDKIDQLRSIAEEVNAAVANVALAWYLTRDCIDVVIPGTKNPQQLEDNLKTLDVHLSEEQVKRIDQIFAV
ncbi:aldo/keto reductase [Paenibacillus bovis]|uniref:Oxidoreductase n=1 Tax=Paenibacillus bovis TaxID=1616788 RepID=A0A172ZG64_9BACL|nr:aldo/keto reductase [Paenibacillus bovis]ANF96626.1 oxidoreductase [Paenibacillus bovis]